MKKTIIIILIVIIFIFLLSVFRDNLIKSVITGVVTNLTGAKTEIGNLSLGLMQQKIDIKNFKLYNPAGFPNSVLLDIPRIKVDCELSSIFKGKLHIQEMEIDLKQAVIIKNLDGTLNVDALKIAKKDGDKKEPTAKKQTDMQIDELKLNIGWVIYKELKPKDKIIIDGYDLGIKDRVYKNLTSAEQLISLILVESLKHTAIKSAGIYGVASFTGVAFAPVAAAFIFTSKDYTEMKFYSSSDKVFDAALSAIKTLGEVSNADKKTGIITGKIRDADIKLELKKGNGKTDVKATARKLLFPSPQISGGLIYEISQILK
ncbi:MAG: hypothetical protein FJZ15_00045 [Candidatus Omnitrophica bacterium]|nr:hypothetical protein [Candidatus Omnitrophota bacterium]